MIDLPDDLSPFCIAAFRRIEQAANAGEYILQADIDDAIGTRNSSGSTQASVCKSLERRGLIKRFYYQRGRQIMVTATGAMTAPPKNTAPHWRDRPRTAAMPSVSTSYIRQRKPDLVQEMERAARKEGKSLQDFVFDLIWAGWCERQAAIQSDGERG